MLGRLRPRCGSLAMIAPPVVVRLRRDGDAVAARPGDGLEDRGEIAAARAHGEARLRAAAGVDQPRPELRPVVALAQLQQVEPDEPGHVGPRQPAEGEQVLHRPRLALQPQRPVLVGQHLQAVLVEVDAFDEALHPAPRLRRHAGFGLGGGLAEVEDAQAVVDVGGERPAHLGDPALSDPPVDRHLPEAQVGVDQAQGEGGVVVVLGLDERDLVVVPHHLHPALERQAGGGEGLQPLDRRCVSSGSGLSSAQPASSVVRARETRSRIWITGLWQARSGARED